jgi:hypothetical protein
MTELYMIQDKSADFEETWNFLGRRIEDVSYFHSYLHQSGEVSHVAKEAVAAAFITVCQHSDMFCVYCDGLYFSGLLSKKSLHINECLDGQTEEN